MIRSIEVVLIIFLAASQFSCATSASKFKPDDIREDRAAFVGRVQVFNHGEDVTSSCYAEFKDASGDLKLYSSLDKTGWIFGTVKPGDTFLSRIYCAMLSVPATVINVKFDDLKFSAPGKDQMPYFGSLVFRFNRTKGSLLGPFVGDVGTYEALRQGERLLTVVDDYVLATREYRDRYMDQDRTLRVFDATMPWPIVIDCQKFQKIVKFVLANHYSTSELTSEISDRANKYFLQWVDPTSKEFSSTENDRVRRAIATQISDFKTCDSLDDIRRLFVEKAKKAEIRLAILDAIENMSQEPINALVLKALVKSLDAYSDLYFDSSRVFVRGQKTDQRIISRENASAPALNIQSLSRNDKNFDIAVIKVGTLSPGVNLRIKTLLEEAKARSVSAVILDLSSSPGGLLEEVAEIVGLFASNAPAYAIKRRQGKIEHKFTKERDPVYSGPLAVLVDEDTASGSETVAGSLRDLNLALLIGHPVTYGNGILRSVFDVGTGRVLGLSVGIMYTPSGRSAQFSGIHPDVQISTGKKDVLSKGASLEGMLPPGNSIVPFVPDRFKKELVTRDERGKLQAKASRRNLGAAKESLVDGALEVVADWLERTRGAQAELAHGIASKVSLLTLPKSRITHRQSAKE